jgi:hypothetical protein
LPDPRQGNPFANQEMIKHIANSIGNPGMEVVGNILSAGKNAIGAGINYIRPQKSVDEFMNVLGGGKTAEENITELAKRLHFGRNSASQEALAYKEPVFNALGEEKIVPTITRKSISTLDKAGRPTVKRSLGGDYFTQNEAEPFYSGKIKTFHKEFEKNPTLNNSDALQKQIGSRIGELNDAQLKGPLEPIQSDELEALTKARDHLISDQEKFMENQHPMYREQYKIFRDKWKQNVTPYDETPILTQMARRGAQHGFTPGEIKGIFAYPNEKVSRIAKDIGPSGHQNIIYNEIQEAGKHSPDTLAKALAEAKQFGYQSHMTPEMELLAKNLPARYTTSEALKTAGRGALGAGIGELLGHPLLGLAIGASMKKGSDLGKKLLELKK